MDPYIATVAGSPAPSSRSGALIEYSALLLARRGVDSRARAEDEILRRVLAKHA